MPISRFRLGMTTAVAAIAMAALSPPVAHGDATAYLFNIVVRPGYHFSGPEDALQYGDGLCDDVSAGRLYGQLIGKVKRDMQTTDEYQAGYLINQAINELCPAQIWQLRQSAAGYRPAIEPS